MYKTLFILILGLVPLWVNAQDQDSSKVYKKRVLESVEVDFLSSYYQQDGENAATSGGIGSEAIENGTGGIHIAIPINADDILAIDANVSAYSSASSSNINPFDQRRAADAFVASSGESQADVLVSGKLSYTHYSDNRNQIWSAHSSFGNEYDYRSFGIGASFSQLWNEKNTELSVKANVFLDNWSLIYPVELRGPGMGDDDDDDDENFNIQAYTITGNVNYQPQFSPLQSRTRNSYALGLNFAQILSRNMQALIAMDVIYQQGQLSTPFHRVHFQDVADAYIENFHLADDIERLPNHRLKTAIGTRVNYYVNEFLCLRSFYRYYFDDWGIQSHTAEIEVPIKFFMGQLTLAPAYRFYNQTAVRYFNPYNQHQSSDQYYTSDYDLSAFHAHQMSIGLTYRDLFGHLQLWKIGVKNIQLKYYHYSRNSSFNSQLLSLAVQFLLE